MPKNYAEALGEWVRRRESTKRDKNMVAFLAVRDDVKDALDAGYPVKTIWTNMHEARRITVCYDTFLTLVARHIGPVKKRRPTGQERENSPAGSEQAANHEPAGKPAPVVPKRPEPLTGFTFNAAPKKEDLL